MQQEAMATRRSPQARGSTVTKDEVRQAGRREAREYIAKAKDFAERGIEGDDANWATAYATIALAILAESQG
jgi:hypothetical protein